MMAIKCATIMTCERPTIDPPTHDVSARELR